MNRRDLIAYLRQSMEIDVYSPPVRGDAERPFVVLTLVSAVVDQQSISEVGLTDYTWQLDVYGDTFDAVEQLRDKIFEALNKPGEHPRIGATLAAYCRVENMEELTELELEGGENPLVRFTIEARIII